jgi:hypothetical protein
VRFISVSVNVFRVLSVRQTSSLLLKLVLPHSRKKARREVRADATKSKRPEFPDIATARKSSGSTFSQFLMQSLIKNNLRGAPFMLIHSLQLSRHVPAFYCSFRLVI